MIVSESGHEGARRRLEVAGERVGVRAAELCSFRDKPGKRETRLVNMLQVGGQWNPQQ